MLGSVSVLSVSGCASNGIVEAKAASITLHFSDLNIFLRMV
jgi:hypothetical protein